MTPQKNTIITVLLLFILLWIAWFIWKPLVVLILVGFFLKYWYESRVVIIPFGGYHDQKQYEHPEDLLKCKICKIYFHKDHFQEHILQAVIKEQELINEMPILSFMMAKNQHKEYYNEAFAKILERSGQFEIDNDDNTKAVIKGSRAKLVDKTTGRVIKEIDLEKSKSKKL